MADIELVIKIPERAYEEIKNGADIEINYGEHIVVKDDWASKIIRNGTPLPKGHGRLIDADALIFNADYYEPLISKRDFDFAPTIIEADKGEQE